MPTQIGRMRPKTKQLCSCYQYMALSCRPYLHLLRIELGFLLWPGSPLVLAGSLGGRGGLGRLSSTGRPAGACSAQDGLALLLSLGGGLLQLLVQDVLQPQHCLQHAADCMLGAGLRRHCQQ